MRPSASAAGTIRQVGSRVSSTSSRTVIAGSYSPGSSCRPPSTSTPPSGSPKRESASNPWPAGRSANVASMRKPARAEPAKKSSSVKVTVARGDATAATASRMVDLPDPPEPGSGRGRPGDQVAGDTADAGLNGDRRLQRARRPAAPVTVEAAGQPAGHARHEGAGVAGPRQLRWRPRRSGTPHRTGTGRRCCGA
jgi:hypothetical protein